MSLTDWMKPPRLEVEFETPPFEFRFRSLLVPQRKHYILDHIGDPGEYREFCTPLGLGEVPSYVEYYAYEVFTTCCPVGDEEALFISLQRQLELTGWLDHEPTLPGIGPVGAVPSVEIDSL